MSLRSWDNMLLFCLDRAWFWGPSFGGMLWGVGLIHLPLQKLMNDPQGEQPLGFSIIFMLNCCLSVFDMHAFVTANRTTSCLNIYPILRCTFDKVR